MKEPNLRIVSPSILSADFNHLGREVRMLDRSVADWIHIDVMDGVFVPNISFGFPVVKAVRRLTTKTLDVHLMIVEPDRYIDRFAEAGADVLTVQAEACVHLHRTLCRIRERGMKAGVALNPHTPLTMVEEVLDNADMVLIMTVDPGFGGQSFIPRSMKRIARLREMIDRRGTPTLIQVDGGVTFDNAADLFAAGVNVLVAGNTVFGNANPEDAVRRLLESGIC